MANDLIEFAKDVAYQFGYYCQNKGRLHITHGGLSTLERAFDVLGWENPHPVPECECEIDGCHEHATCGTPTKDGYKMIEKIATAKVAECKGRNEKKFGDGLPRMNENFSYWVKFLETYPMESKKYPAFSLIGEYKALEA